MLGQLHVYDQNTGSCHGCGWTVYDLCVLDTPESRCEVRDLDRLPTPVVDDSHLDPTVEWLTHPGEDLARRIDIALAHGPSTDAILADLAEWISDIELTQATAVVSSPSQDHTVAWIRDEIRRVSQSRNRSGRHGRGA